jgi:CMP-2-keto-3-deoxyoctulosonic acid synthetase
LPISKLENTLKLEQLRALENNILLKTLKYKGKTYRGIDTPDDLALIRKHFTK